MGNKIMKFKKKINWLITLTIFIDKLLDFCYYKFI